MVADKEKFGLNMTGYPLDQFRDELVRTYNDHLRPVLPRGNNLAKIRGDKHGYMKWVVTRLQLDSLEFEAGLPPMSKMVYSTSEKPVPQQFAGWARIMDDHEVEVFNDARSEAWMEAHFARSGIMEVWKALPTPVMRSDLLR